MTVDSLIGMHVLESFKQEYQKMLPAFAAINENQRLTGREMDGDLEVPRNTFSEIVIWDLGIKHMARKLVRYLQPQE